MYLANIKWPLFRVSIVRTTNKQINMFSLNLYQWWVCGELACMKLSIHKDMENTLDLKYTIQHQKFIILAVVTTNFRGTACNKPYILSVDSSPFQKMSNMQFFFVFIHALFLNFLYANYYMELTLREKLSLLIQF